MKMFKRLWRVIKSWLNFFIGKAENPQKMLTQAIRDIETQLGESKSQVAVAIADEKRLQKQVDRERKLAGDWESKAMLAVSAGDDNLASEALKRKKEHDQYYLEFNEQWEKQKTACEALRTNLKNLQQKVEASRRKKNVLIARSKRAEAQQNINEAMDNMSSASSLGVFNEMADKIEQAESEAEASAELNEEFSGDNLEDQFRDLEAGNTDDDLLALKQKMGVVPVPEPAPAVRVEAIGEATEAQIEEAIAEEEAQERAEEIKTVNN